MDILAEIDTMVNKKGFEFRMEYSPRDNLYIVKFGPHIAYGKTLINTFKRARKIALEKPKTRQ